MSSCLEVYLGNVQKKDTFRYTMHVPLILYIKSNNWKGQYKKIKRYPFDKRDRVKNTLLIYSVFSFSDFLSYFFFFSTSQTFYLGVFFSGEHISSLVLLHVFFIDYMQNWEWRFYVLFRATLIVSEWIGFELETCKCRVVAEKNHNGSFKFATMQSNLRHDLTNRC